MGNPRGELEVTSRKLYDGKVQIDTNGHVSGTENAAYASEQMSKALQISADACANRHTNNYLRDDGL